MTHSHIDAELAVRVSDDIESGRCQPRIPRPKLMSTTPLAIVAEPGPGLSKGSGWPPALQRMCGQAAGSVVAWQAG